VEFEVTETAEHMRAAASNYLGLLAKPREVSWSFVDALSCAIAIAHAAAGKLLPEELLVEAPRSEVERVDLRSIEDWLPFDLYNQALEPHAIELDSIDLPLRPLELGVQR
jgi:hypothetical protein